MPIQTIGNEELKQLMAAEKSLVVLDVRMQDEYLYLGHLPEATLIPLHTLPAEVSRLDPLQKTVVLCQHGLRSLNACEYLNHLGFQHLYNLEAGMAEWDGPVVRETL